MSLAIGAHQAPVAAPGRTPADLALAGMIAKGHGREACAAYLGLTDAALMDRVVHLDLPTPADRPMRLGHGQGAWALDATRRLVDLWLRNLTTDVIGSTLGRAPDAIRRKARWLGLPRRAPRDLLQPLPLFPDLDLPGCPRRHEIRWTDDLERWLAERWLAFQHHRAIARDLSALLGAPVSPTTVASKAHRLELPQRDKYFLLDTYAPGNRERHAHLLPKVTERRCKIRGHLFWSTGDRTSAEAKKQALYHSLCSGIPDSATVTMH